MARQEPMSDVDFIVIKDKLIKAGFFVVLEQDDRGKIINLKASR